MIRAWQVLVRMRTHQGKIVARKRVDVMALDPGAACPSSYIVVRDDMKRTAASTKTKIPKIGSVSFLVRPFKPAKET